MAKRKSHEHAGILVQIPAEDVGVVLDTLEQALEDIYEGGCDCDDCARYIVTLEDLTEKILATAQIKTSV